MSPVTVKWNPCPNAVSAAPTSTHVERSIDGGVTFNELGSKPYGENILDLEWLDATVSVGGTYVYRMRWFNSAGPGPYSANSLPITITQAVPAQPVIVSVTQA